MTQFQHIDTKEIVRIISDEGNFLTLNNGFKIDRTLFAQKYAALPSTNNNSMPSMNAEDFMNTRPSIQINTQHQQQPIVNEGIINTNAAPVDPIDFLNSTSMSVTGVENIQKIDTSKYLEVHESQRIQIKDLSQQQPAGYAAPQNLEAEKRALLENYNRTHNIQTPPAQFVDENDDRAVDQMMNGMQQPVKQVVLNENGLTEAQEYMRQQQLEITGVDPFADKISKYRASKGYNPQPVQNPRIEQPVQQEQPQPQQVQTQQMPQINYEDPIIAFFKRIKRNHAITINLKIKDKISNPDYIKSTVENLDGDIIQYYTDEIFTSYLSNIQNLKQDIYNQIHKEVYGCLPGKDEEEPKIVKKTELKINNVEQVSEDVVILVPGKPTKDGKRTFKYVNESGKVVDMLPELADEKGLKPAVVSKITEGKQKSNVKNVTSKRPKVDPAPQKAQK